MESIYLVITTFPTRDEAVSLANQIIAKHLAACVQVQEACISIYEWKGVVERSVEFPVHIKTIESKKEEDKEMNEIMRLSSGKALTKESFMIQTPTPAPNFLLGLGSKLFTSF
jgi:uncharacterized protein involved in tolerance to divalent cations